tara:strand:- start:4356 stop:4817 length:462 start_codon:yes stop_codon:yes gene_type:complete
MKNDKLIRTIKKRLGESINVSCSSRGCYHSVYNGYDLSWSVDRDGDVSGIHTKGVNQTKDSMTDYFPGTWWKNAGQMLDFLSPPAPKFKAGDMVRFKDIQRNHRSGLVGECDLIVEVGGGRTYSLMKMSSYIEPIYGTRIDMPFDERDLELVE